MLCSQKMSYYINKTVLINRIILHYINVTTLHSGTLKELCYILLLEICYIDRITLHCININVTFWHYVHGITLHHINRTMLMELCYIILEDLWYV